MPLRPMRVGELLDAAIKLYRFRWKTFMGIVAFVMVPYTFLESYFSYVMVGSIASREVLTTRQAVTGAIVAASLALVGFLFVQPFLTAATARAAVETYQGHQPTVKSTYRFALSRTHSILLVLFLTALAVLGGFILLIVPGIIFMIRFTFAPTVVVVEGLRGRAAMKRSWRLSREFFWKVLGVTLLAGLLSSLVAGVVAIPLTMVAFAVGAEAWPVSALGSSMGSIVAQPFTSIVGVLLYFDLRIRKEGLDLAVTAQDLARPAL